MLASARQLLAAGLERGTERRVVLLLVAGAAQPAGGVRVGEAGQAVVPHALRELAHLVHEGRVSGLFMLAAWRQVAARLLGALERGHGWRVVADAAEPPVGVRVGKAGHAVIPHALRERERLLPASSAPRKVARRRAAGCD